MPIQNSWNNVLLNPRFAGASEGDLFYANASTALTRLPRGTSGQILAMGTTIPQWQTGAAPNGNAGGDFSGTYPNPTIATNAVTFAKMQNMGTGLLLGRNTAGTGNIETIDATTGRTILGLGSAATVNTGTAAGNIPLLQAGGVLDPAVIPAIALNTIQVVADQTARLALANVQPGDCAKQTSNGITYMLSVLPATIDANWVAIGDTAIDGSEITSGTIAAARLGGGTPSASNYLRGDGTWAAVVGGSSFNWQVYTANQQMSADNGYIANSLSPITFSLPLTAAVGTRLAIAGYGTGGWRIAQSVNQNIAYLGLTTTTGSGGSIATETTLTQSARASLDMVCVVANTSWLVIDGTGVVDVV